MVDEIIDNNLSNKANALPDDTNDIITRRDSDACKEVVNAINTRGGQNGISHTKK